MAEPRARFWQPVLKIRDRYSRPKLAGRMDGRREAFDLFSDDGSTGCFRGAGRTTLCDERQHGIQVVA